MSESTDPYLDKLGDEWVAARKAEIPDINKVRATRDRFIEYLAECVLDVMDGCAAPEPRLHVITNEGPVPRNPRRMSSPIKTDEIRAFEAQVNRIFGINASATTEWPAAKPRICGRRPADVDVPGRARGTT